MEEKNKINNAYIYLRFNGGEYKEQMYKQLMNDFISSKYKNQNIKIKYFIDYNGRAMDLCQVFRHIFMDKLLIRI